MRRELLCAVAVALTCALAFPPNLIFSTSKEISLSEVTPIREAASGHLITYDGVGPGEVSLNWTPEAPPCLRYLVEYSSNGSSGPWTAASANTVLLANASYSYALPPGSTFWWHVVYLRGTLHPRTECARYSQDNVSTVLRLTQPNSSLLTAVQLNSSTIRFNWSNDAVYAGHLEFGSYQLMESVNGTSFVAAARWTNASNLSYTFTGILPGTSYSFYVNTTDLCKGCRGGPFPSSSASNMINFGPPAPLRASASASRTAADANQPITYNCQTQGGGSAVGDTYTWDFGDGFHGAGPSPMHSYSSPGLFSAACAVTNLTGSSASATVNVTVSSDPQVTTPRMTPATPVLGQSVNFSTVASGGSGGYAFVWVGLPPGCGSLDRTTVPCALDITGTSDVYVVVTDSNGFSTPSAPLNISLGSNPMVLDFIANPPNVTLGGLLSLTVIESGGTPPLFYNYFGLPPGCYSPDAPSFTCVPTQVGQFVVQVAITDSAGLQASDSVNVSISAPPATLGVWLPAVELALVVTTIGIGAIVVLAVVVHRRKGAGRVAERSQPQSIKPAISPPPGMPSTVEGEGGLVAALPPLGSGVDSEPLPPPEPQVIPEVRQLLGEGENSGAVLWAFESVLAELSKKSPGRWEPHTTYRDRLAPGGGARADELSELLDRLYRSYEPVRYGQETAPETRDLIRLLTRIYELPPFRS